VSTLTCSYTYSPVHRPIAAVERLRIENPDSLQNCVACAGLSLGEFAALVHAGSLTFEDGLRIVQRRGHAMEKAATAGEPSSMVRFGFTPLCL
jgi:[acyl-carrier-protein] S-malonyltransferase